MKLVIDIPENIYECVKKTIISDEIFDELVDVFRNGTTLPKGHGRLVDIGKFEQKQRYADPWKLTRKVGQVIRDLENVELSELPTIIEADMTESEEV